MLTLLRVRNLALFDSAEITFGTGLTVLTGESGSGKSLILDALHLLAGASRPRLSVRTGHGSGFVEAEFQLARGPAEHLLNEELAACLGEVGFGAFVTHDEGPLVLTRRLESTGRSRCFIQGQTVSRATLSRIASHLLEICGQSEAHHLRTSLAQLEALDRFAGLSEARRNLGRWVCDLRESDALYDTRKKQLEESERREDFVRYQLQELSAVDVESWEQAEARLCELEHACRSLKSCKEVVQLLGADAKVLGQLRWLSTRLGQDPAIDPRLSDQLELAVDALGSCEKIALRSLEEADTLRVELDELRDAVALLKEVAGKHRVEVPALPQRAETLRQELAELGRAQAAFEALEQARTELSAKVQKLAAELHEARRRALPALQIKLAEELSRVGLKDAQFSAQVGIGELTASGVTQLELCFSANPGHPALPLSRVASGGELARILLAFRLATETTGSVLVFDEIDAGAGGRTAEKIAKSLGQASEKTQVLAITHWPQVAGTARAHISVEKRSSPGDTTSVLCLLDEEQRLDELARMLGGNSETARSHATRLLKRSGEQPPETGNALSPAVLGADRLPHEKRRRSGQCRVVAA